MEIKKIQYEPLSKNVVLEGGQEFHPVTTSKAVYDISNGNVKTLYDVLHGSYNDSYLNKYSNGIYEWLEHLNNKFNDYATKSDLRIINANISNLSDTINSASSDITNYKTGITRQFENFIDSVNRIVDFKYDAEPVQGSTKLVSSGGIYSYISKMIKTISRESSGIGINQVADILNYNAYDGEIVMYVGETIENFETNCLYQYNITASESHGRCGDSDIEVTGTWTKISSASINPDSADLTNYYTKVEIDNKISRLPDKDTQYFADNTTISISDENVISAIIPQYYGDATTIEIDPVTKVIRALPQSVDLSSYYNKTEVDDMISGVSDSVANLIQGQNISLSKSGKNITISANIPQVVVPDMRLYYTSQQIDDMFDANKPVIYTGDNQTISVSNENVISAIIPQQRSYVVSEGGNNVHVATTTTDNMTSFEISVDTPSVNNGILTVKQGDTTLGQFSADQSNDVEITIPDSELVIHGDNGDVVYHDGNGVFTQKIMCDGYVVTDSSELAECKDAAPSFADVFLTWKKFSHLDANDNAVSADLNNWYYDSTLNTVVQPNNSTSYNGFISPKSYSTYDITVRVYSTNQDDDTIGLVAAFAKDSNGKEHTLSFVRAANGTGGKTWVAVLDYRAFSLTSTANGQAIIIDKSETAPASVNKWSELGTGSVINITRNGNVFTAKCSQFNSNTIDSSTLITIDLDTWSNVYPALELFKGKAPWGYSNFSQAQSKYENISIPNDNFIFDLVNDEVLLFNFNTKLWEVMPNTTPIEAIGTGRFSYNDITKKMFYNDGSNVIEVSRKLAQKQSDWDEANSSDAAYIKNKPTLFSGSYNDLTNKPTIPQVQVVADEATYNAMTKDANTLYLIPAAV